MLASRKRNSWNDSSTSDQTFDSIKMFWTCLLLLTPEQDRLIPPLVFM